MGKRASPGGLSSTEEKELDHLIAKTGFMSQKKARGGRIGYRLGDEVEQVTEEVVETPEGIQTVDLDNIPDWWLTDFERLLEEFKTDNNGQNPTSINQLEKWYRFKHEKAQGGRIEKPRLF